MSIRINVWSGRLAEVAANFILPGLGGFIFDRAGRTTALWQMVLSGAGMVLSGAGAAILLQVLVSPLGAPVNEEYVKQVLLQPDALYKILMAVAGVIFGGILAVGGFLWSLDSAMRRWRKDEPAAVEPPPLPGAE